MNRTPVTSSNVNSVGWESNVLEVEFKGGAVYRYAAVPEAVYLELIASKSVGTYLNRHVKNSYAFERVAA